MAGDDFLVFNGRGGLDMIACLDAGCDGFLLAPDLADYAIEVMRLYDHGKREEALALHGQVLPAISFIMRSLEHLICYGKRMFSARAGLEVFDRAPALRPEAAEIADMERLLSTLGSCPAAQAGAKTP
jgi:dihydrodipicolinate synthase/N-acetylneuraminate lyase